jgi:hypothetical protein
MAVWDRIRCVALMRALRLLAFPCGARREVPVPAAVRCRCGGGRPPYPPNTYLAMPSSSAASTPPPATASRCIPPSPPSHDEQLLALPSPPPLVSSSPSSSRQPASSTPLRPSSLPSKGGARGRPLRRRDSHASAQSVVDASWPLKLCSRVAAASHRRHSSDGGAGAAGSTSSLAPLRSQRGSAGGPSVALGAV